MGAKLFRLVFTSDLIGADAEDGEIIYDVRYFLVTLFITIAVHYCSGNYG